MILLMVPKMLVYDQDQNPSALALRKQKPAGPCPKELTI